MKNSLKFILFAVLICFASCGQNEEEASVSTSNLDTVSDFLSAYSEESSLTEETVSEWEDENNSDEFYILYTEGEVDFSKAPKAEINIYPWGDEYTPYAYGQVVFKKDDGFYVFMYCRERDPLTTVTETDGAVYRDSCLEFFCDYYPTASSKTEKTYINLEMNSAGVYLAKYNGISVSSLSRETITVTGERHAAYWTVTAHIPLKLIEDIYGSVSIGVGSAVDCNFSKCGSGTKIPHYGTWQDLPGKTPNFHQPAYFAKVYIK